MFGGSPRLFVDKTKTTMMLVYVCFFLSCINGYYVPRTIMPNKYCIVLCVNRSITCV